MQQREQFADSSDDCTLNNQGDQDMSDSWITLQEHERIKLQSKNTQLLIDQKLKSISNMKRELERLDRNDKKSQAKIVTLTNSIRQAYQDIEMLNSETIELIENGLKYEFNKIVEAEDKIQDMRKTREYNRQVNKVKEKVFKIENMQQQILSIYNPFQYQKNSFREQQQSLSASTQPSTKESLCEPQTEKREEQIRDVCDQVKLSINTIKDDSQDSKLNVIKSQPKVEPQVKLITSNVPKAIKQEIIEMEDDSSEVVESGNKFRPTKQQHKNQMEMSALFDQIMLDVDEM